MIHKAYTTRVVRTVGELREAIKELPDATVMADTELTFEPKGRVAKRALMANQVRGVGEVKVIDGMKTLRSLPPIGWSAVTDPISWSDPLLRQVYVDLKGAGIVVRTGQAGKGYGQVFRKSVIKGSKWQASALTQGHP